MKKLVLVPALALAALMAGCGGGSTTATGPVTTAAAPSSAASSAPSSAAASPSASSSASSSAAAGDICALLSTDKVNELTGGSYTTQTKQSNRCTYQVGSSQTDALLTGLKQSTESLDSLVASEKKALGGTSKSTDVAGADDAAVVTATENGNNVVSVLGKKDDMIYLVIIENTKSASQLETSAGKVLEALIAA